MSISYIQFVEKYQLIPKNLRFRFLDVLSHYRHKIVTRDDFFILDDLITTLYCYERAYHDIENYLELGWALYDHVCPIDDSVYSDVAVNLLSQLREYKKSVLIEDVVRFRHKNVMKDILEIVAYRPGNPGYERAFEHFMGIALR
jgi:hypothetical protein